MGFYEKHVKIILNYLFIDKIMSVVNSNNFNLKCILHNYDRIRCES